MKFINKRQEPEVLLASSQHSPFRFLVKGVVNFAWILFGFRVLFMTRSNGVFPFYAPCLAVIIPATYCFWRNWTKFHTCIQVYNNKIVLFPEDESPITLGYLQLRALVLKKKNLELLTNSQSFSIPIYADYKKVLQQLILQYRKQTGKLLIVVDERKVK